MVFVNIVLGSSPSRLVLYLHPNTFDFLMTTAEENWKPLPSCWSCQHSSSLAAQNCCQQHHHILATLLTDPITGTMTTSTSSCLIVLASKDLLLLSQVHLLTPANVPTVQGDQHPSFVWVGEVCRDVGLSALKQERPRQTRIEWHPTTIVVTIATAADLCREIQGGNSGIGSKLLG